MTTQHVQLNRSPTPDEAAGMTWWNNLGEIARGYWLAHPGCGTVADAYAAFKRDQASCNSKDS